VAPCTSKNQIRRPAKPKTAPKPQSKDVVVVYETPSLQQEKANLKGNKQKEITKCYKKVSICFFNRSRN